MSARPNGKRIAQTEATLLDTIQSDLYTAVISDALDELEIRHQAMREYVRPLLPDAVYAGWARTILCMDVYYTSEKPYALEIEAIDSILEDEVVVVATHSSVRNAPWGELLSTAAQARGARGAVVDGLVRDVKKILSLGFPVHASGVKPVDSRGRGEVVDYNVPVQCGGVLVNPKDLVVADYDGVVVIPAAAVEQTIHLATEKVARENNSRADLKNGAYLRNVFDKYGVL
jgi:regulator of RNase E activity RraA